ncbi:hypothetical protein [Psychrobacillus sp. OK032]|uniref:hypothetical protein n=1 Tax=Psychrobacillus sp. OK032 TaxID=1884358 RepID=UPI001C4301A6|nr:hypothetical protein [Psychrobacillus sp. OK032]
MWLVDIEGLFKAGVKDITFVQSQWDVLTLRSQESVQVDKPKENKGLDTFQTVLDVAGLVPGFGEVADGINGVIYSFRGDTTNAALSFWSDDSLFRLGEYGREICQ